MAQRLRQQEASAAPWLRRGGMGVTMALARTQSGRATAALLRGGAHFAISLWGTDTVS